MALTKAEIAQQAQLKLVNDLSAGTITQAQFQAGIAKINAQLLKEQAPTQDTVTNKLASTPPAPAGSAAQINQQYTQYQVKLANDLKSGKITQTQFQNEFEKLLAQQNAALARVPKVSKTEDARIANNPPAVVDANTSTASEVTSSEPIKPGTDSNKKKPPLPNPLLAYPLYTYGLSLALLTVDEYNKVIDDTKNYQANRVIIASAGRYNNDEGVSMFKRAPFFAEDFYFENLDMTTVIGLNDHSRATNAITFKFTIIEPYGVTLLNRIIDLSASIGSKNYIAQPYLLQIDFFGTNDAGEIVGIIPDQTKRMPIRILKMDIKASPKGAEYSIEASPYSHSAWDVSSSGTPANFEITAGSIESFFKSNEEENLAAQLKANRELKSSTIIRAAPTAGADGRGVTTIAGRTGNLIGPEGQLLYAPSLLMSKETTNIVLGKDPVYKVKSYGGAINAYYADLAATGKTSVADRYYFKFHDDIIKEGGFNISAETLSTAQTPMASQENGMTIRGSANTSVDHNARVFGINAGTSIDQVISFAMRHTHYLQGQVKPASAFAADGKDYKAYLEKLQGEPLKWFKIIPVVKLGEYNIKEERWARDITYHVVPYTVYNTKIPSAPQGVWTNPCKVHNYWYTGKNNDVIDFNVEFNALYYTGLTAYKENLSKVQNLLIEKTIDAPLSAEAQQANAVAPAGQKPIIGDTQKHATGGAITVEAITLADVESSLYTTAGGDMLQAKLKIIGDPQYIKQDDIFYPPVLTALSDQVDNTGIDPRLIANGSLHMDQGEIYVQVTVKSPVDIDETTGLMNFDPKYKTSLFSGMYRVLRVENHFSGGKFEQVIDMVRLPRQQSLEPSAAPKITDNAREATAATPLSVNVDAATIGPDFTVKRTSDDKAPDSAPVEDTTPPLQTAEEKALAKVDATAPETAITTQTEPVAVPPPV
jgi:hypothetical protein